jgi:hypothetical protein
MFRLDGSLLDELVRARFRLGAEDLLARWHPDGAGKDPVTIWRWINRGQMPKSEAEFLKLSGLLDVDPFSLVTVDGPALDSVIDDLLAAARRNRWGKFRFFGDFFGRQRAWPPRALAQEHFKREWSMRDFEHTSADHRNYYQAVRLIAAPSWKPCFPQVFHFAFRQSDRFAGQWLAYGFVVVRNRLVRLQHINGFRQELELAPGEPVCVSTFFGPDPAHFRVASLHEFTLDMAGDVDPGRSVRFP